MSVKDVARRLAVAIPPPPVPRHDPSMTVEHSEQTPSLRDAEGGLSKRILESSGHSAAKCRCPRSSLSLHVPSHINVLLDM